MAWTYLAVNHKPLSGPVGTTRDPVTDFWKIKQPCERDAEGVPSHREGCEANMVSTNGLKCVSDRTHRYSFHFLLFFLIILFLAWFALSPSITSPNQCSRSSWKNGQPQSHIHLNHFNANIDRRSIDTGWAALFFFLMVMPFFFFFFLFPGLCYPW